MYNSPDDRGDDEHGRVPDQVYISRAIDTTERTWIQPVFDNVIYNCAPLTTRLIILHTHTTVFLVSVPCMLMNGMREYDQMEVKGQMKVGARFCKNESLAVF